MTLRVLFYVQHLLGIGHVVRALRIARALRGENFTVKLVMGGMPVPGMDLRGLDIVQLPPIQSGTGGFNDLVDETGAAITESYWARRSHLLLDCLQAFKPDIVLIEAYPFGRRQMRFELLPMLEGSKKLGPSPLIAVSVRDILQENRKQKRLEETVDILNRYFDMILVHGDERFNQLKDTFPLADNINADIFYTGIVAGDEPEPAKERFDVIVSAGGGAVGEILLETSMAARPLTSLANARWLFLTGPNFPEPALADFAKKNSRNVCIERFRSDLDALFYTARISISQCGYNTVADILRAGCASVVVPFSSGGESEQTRRATSLSARGRLTMVGEDNLSPSNLARAFEHALSYQSDMDKLKISLDGARQSAIVLRRVHSERS